MPSPEGYVKLQVYVSEKMNKEFRSFIAKRYQSYEKGLLSHEVQRALGHWLKIHTGTQEFDIKAPNPQPKIGKYYTYMKEWLLAGTYDLLPPGSVINTIQLEKAIQNTRGYDKRTVDKWKRRFVENKLIKNLSPNQWELIA